MSKYTVIGGKGFIGSHIVELLRSKGEEVVVPERNCESIFKEDLDILIYAAGNGDCIQKPFEVFNSNCRLLSDILEKSTFNKLIYISSTRVYMEQEASEEDADVTICNSDKRRLFNLTKLVAEELCLKSGHDVVIVRPSNVYGLALNSTLFLPSIVRNAINNNHIDMYVAPEYAKDYVSVTDVAEIIYKISNHNEHIIYNIASGENTSAQQIADVITFNTGCTVDWHSGFVGEKFPVTDITRSTVEFEYRYANVLSDMKVMIDSFKKSLKP